MTAHKLPTLRRNFSWTFAGNVYYAATQWGILTVLAKIGTPQMVGRFALGLAVTAPVIMLMKLQLREVQATDAKFRYRFGDYLTLRLVGMTLALVIIVVIVFVAGYRRETALVILAVGLAKAFESVSDVFYGLFIQREHMDRMAKSMIIRGSLSLVALSMGVYFTGSLVWGVVGLGFVWAVVLLGYDVRSGAHILRTSPLALPEPAPTEVNPATLVQSYWHIGTLGRLAWLAFPLGVTMGLITLTTNIPLYFIEQYLGERELGIFAAMVYVTVAGATVVNALGQSAMSRLAKHYAARNGSEFCALLLRLVGIGALLGVAGVLVTLAAGQEILTLLYGPEYAEQAGIFTWVMVAGGITYVASTLGYGMTSARYFNVQVPLFACLGCTTAVACLWLVPAAGLQGAAIATLIAGLVQGCISLVVVGHAVRGLRSPLGGSAKR